MSQCYNSILSIHIPNFKFNIKGRFPSEFILLSTRSILNIIAWLLSYHFCWMCINNTSIEMQYINLCRGCPNTETIMRVSNIILKVYVKKRKTWDVDLTSLNFFSTLLPPFCLQYARRYTSYGFSFILNQFALNSNAANFLLLDDAIVSNQWWIVVY